jgi:hypothetical protein
MFKVLTKLIALFYRNVYSQRDDDDGDDERGTLASNNVWVIN